MMKMNKSVLVIMTVLLLSASLVAAIFVYMSGDQTIKTGDTANFKCTVDPMLGPASYEVRLVGNGVDKVLASGTNAASVFDVPVSVGPADYGSVTLNSAKEFDVQCTAKETSCDPCCCDSDTETSKLKIYNCPASDWMCSDQEVRQFWRWYWDGSKCVFEITQTAEDCDEVGGAYGDGCYAYGGTGCENRDYFCVESTGTGAPCSYDWSNRHSDSYGSYVFYCTALNGDLYKHRKFYDYACNGAHGGTCALSSENWGDNTLVQDCGEDSCDNWQKVCGIGDDANKVFNSKTCHDRGCASLACFDTVTTETNLSEDCDDKDGWKDTGSTRWVADGVCSEKEQKEQKYKDYYCSAGACDYTVTDTKWVNTGNTRFKPSTVMCRAGAGVCDVPEYCTGVSAECPTDSKKPNTFECRASAGVCDETEYCTGTANDCPTNGFKLSTFECRSGNGVCDPGEYCTGSAAACPGNIYAPYNTSCSDGLFCNGNEVCNEVGQCIGGDEVSCVGLNILKIETCDNNPDNIHFTWDFRSAFTSTCIEANDSCSNGNETITHQCSKEHCTAQCESNADCDDQNSHTTDTCLANCTCKHDTNDYCGDGIIQGTEVCELPNTNNNAYCGQTNTSCSGAKLGIRDLFGNCNANCGCTPDNFIYSCVKDICGATCDDNSDCADYCDGNIKHFGSTCDLTTSCSCSGGSTFNCDSLDGWYDTGNKRWSNTTVCNEKEQKEQEQRNYACTAGAIVNCTYTATGTQWIDTGNTRFKANGTSCDDGLFCNGNNVCNDAGQCIGGQTVNCSAFNFGKVDTCYNDPDSNPYTWDHRDSFISTCDEINDRCTTGNDTITHVCKDKECAAPCIIDEDCNDYNPLSTDICFDNCTCSHEWHPGCGDAILQVGEACDDGNFLSGDGCSASCTVEVMTSSSGGGSGRRSGGGGGSSITTTSWTCASWSVCADKKQTRTCTNNGASKIETQNCEVVPAPSVNVPQGSPESKGTGSGSSSANSPAAVSVVTGDVPLKANAGDTERDDPVSSVLSKTGSITGAVVGGTSTGTMMTGMFLLALVGIMIASLLLRR